MKQELPQETKEKLNSLLELFKNKNSTETLEQISYLLFIKRLEEDDNAKQLDDNYESIFKNKENCKWSIFSKMSGSQNNEQKGILEHVRDIVFPFLRELDEDKFYYAKYLKNSTFTIENSQALIEAINLIASEELKRRSSSTDGLIYDYLLSQLNVEGDNKQYKTPDHIIDMMVELVAPDADDVICDPVCATGGFLVHAYEKILKSYTSKEFLEKKELVADKLGKEKRAKLEKNIFGFNDNQSMTRTAMMNLMMHMIKNPNIIQNHTLSARYDEQEKYSLILSNPKFNEKINESDLNSSFTIKTADKSIYLYLELVMRLLSTGGRAAIIVSEGLIFDTKGQGKTLKQTLLKDCRLDAVIKLHSKIFQPFGKDVSTSILIFTKSEKTEEVLFYEMENDGLSIDKKRTKVDKTDIPDIIEKFKTKDSNEFNDRTQKYFKVPFKEIKDNNYDLSFNTYKDFIYEEKKYDSSESMLSNIITAEENILENSKKILQITKGGLN